MKEGPSHEKHFFQFSYVEDSHEIEEVASFLGNYETAPGTEICFGIYLNPGLLESAAKREEIGLLCDTARKHPLLTPVVHFSGKSDPKSADGLDASGYADALARIRREMPKVGSIQINDMPKGAEKEILQKAISLGFNVDLPVTNDAFEGLIGDEEQKALIRTNGVFVCLDNSHGSGKQEPIDNAVDKISALLEDDIRRCALYGGLGPMRLGTYRALSRRLRSVYPHVTISIDAESRLKTEDKLDLKKVRVYLHELLLLSGARLKSGVTSDSVHITTQSVEGFKSSCDENGMVAEILRDRCAQYLHGKRVLDVGGGTGDILGAEGVAEGASVVHLDVMDYSHIPTLEGHSRIKGSFFDPKLLADIASEGEVDTIFMSHVTQYLDDDMAALKKSVRQLGARSVITVENTNDDILGKVLEFSKRTYAQCNGEEKLQGFPERYALKESFPFTATLKTASREALAEHLLYLMDIVPDEVTIPPMLEFIDSERLSGDITINQSVNVFEKSDTLTS